LGDETGEDPTRGRAGRFEHGEVTGSFQCGHVDDRRDDAAGDDPQQQPDQIDGALRAGQGTQHVVANVTQGEQLERYRAYG
jgi:hypothetical protein